MLPVPFIFIQMHQIISWGQSSCRIKIKSTIVFYLPKINRPQKRYKTTEKELESCYQILKAARHTRISC
jgi:hypothetical protein